MRTIIINSKVDFSPEQISSISSLSEIVFLEKKPDFSDSVFIDDESKVIAIGPEIVDWKFTNEELNSIMNLKAVCLPTTSYSWVDGVHLKTKGISLTNVPHYSTESVAEYAVWMMIALAKKIPLILKNNWKLDYSTHLGSEVKGKTVGIVGLGSIGRRIGEMVKALGMNVLYWSRSARDDQFQYAELDEVLEKSDFIFPTLAKSEGTKNLLDAKRISEIKNGAHVVSITGDELFDLPAVLDAIKTDKLGGVAFESEKEEMGNYTGNVLVTPPIAWYTKEALNEDMRIWVDSIISCIQNKPINVVNN